MGTQQDGIAVDVETTGLDRETDRIIELPVQRFRFNDLGRVIQVGVPRSGARILASRSTQDHQIDRTYGGRPCWPSHRRGGGRRDPFVRRHNRRA